MLYGGFHIEVNAGDGEARLNLCGELDVAKADELKSVIQHYSDHSVVVIDTTELDFIDSTGLGVLVSARNQLGPGRFQLIPGDATARVLDLSGTKGYFLESETTEADGGPSE